MVKVTTITAAGGTMSIDNASREAAQHTIKQINEAIIQGWPTLLFESPDGTALLLAMDNVAAAFMSAPVQ